MKVEELKEKHYNIDNFGKLMDVPTEYTHTKLSNDRNSLW